MLTGYTLTLCGITFIFGGIALTAIYVLIDGLEVYSAAIVIIPAVVIALGWVIFMTGIDSLRSSRKDSLSYKKTLMHASDFPRLLNDNGKGNRPCGGRKPEKILP